MATQSDTGQLKKLGIALLVLGIVMVAVGYIVAETMWQVYAGGVAALLGAGITVFALKKG